MMADKTASPASLQPTTSTALSRRSQSISSALFPFSRRNSVNTATMASTTPSQSSHDPKKPLDISNLMSPPELLPFESFAQSSMPQSTAQKTSEMRKQPGPFPPLSPPISPLAKGQDQSQSVAPSAGTPLKDPILYPTQDATGSPPQQPLFIRDEPTETQKIVNDHLVARPASFFGEATPPQREDYELMLFFKSQVMKKYKENPRGWLQRERALLLADRKASARNNQFKLHPILPAKPQPLRTHVQRIVKASKPSRQTPAVGTPRPIRSHPPAPRQPVVRRVSATPDPASRRVVAPNREDKDFNALPDYCPPIGSLPPKGNSLKVDWKGSPIDLSNDPHRHLLHPDEIALAAALRLDCATYLTSKRRMFMKRLECLRINKEFRKTDAQQACKIDVNKASKLWTAFDKVGWLDKSWVARYL